MKVIISLLVALMLCPSPLAASGEVLYQISFANRLHHEAEVEVHFTGLARGTLEVRMSRTSPGRYALHDFAKNVYNVRATSASGKSLPVTRPSPHQWNVDGHDGEVRFAYTVFGDRTDGTYLSIDETHAHINIPATFVWARGLEDRPVRVRFENPDPAWRVATQLERQADDTFTAPDLAYFMDSPTELSDHHLEEWSVDGPRGPQTIQLAVHHEGTGLEVQYFAAAARAVVDEQVAVFGEAARFDNGRYVFIADYMPQASGDGMEHRNSTILSGTRTLGSGGAQSLGTVSHEFFHSWNVERIRPASLEPFNLEAANPSSELWFAEGFTSYYGPLTLRRAGLMSLDNFAGSLAWVEAVVNSPGRKVRPAVEMSRQAPLVDGVRWRDPTNVTNTFISYYTYGAALALALDLSMRAQFEETTLDDLMAQLWRSQGRPEKTYSNDDLERALAEVTNAEFATDFFARYIRGQEAPDFAALLGRAGMLVRLSGPDSPWLGSAQMRFSDDGIDLVSGTRRGTPFYLAGLDRNDRIVTLGGERVKDRDELNAWLEARSVGETVEIQFERRGHERTIQLTLASDPSLEVVPFEHATQPLTPEIEAFRSSWLGSRAEHETLHRFCPVCRRAFPFENDYCRYDGAALQLAPPAP